jgi:prepilin-type N-terminal cleavage/methylation domain-containing protein
MRSRSPAAGRDGFTLIEVVVALSISALLLVGARAVLEQLGGHAEAVVGAAAAADREANGQALARALLGRAETNPDAGRRFDGTEAGVRFHTSCDVPAGWLERCEATLGFIAAGGGAPVLAVEAGGADPQPLRRGFRDGKLIYLGDPANGGAWVRNWASAVETPFAVGVVIDGDTLVVPIGERG